MAKDAEFLSPQVQFLLDETQARLSWSQKKTDYLSIMHEIGKGKGNGAAGMVQLSPPGEQRLIKCP